MCFIDEWILWSVSSGLVQSWGRVGSGGATELPGTNLKRSVRTKCSL